MSIDALSILCSKGEMLPSYVHMGKYLIFGEKIAFQNRLGLYSEGNLRLKIDWARL